MGQDLMIYLHLSPLVSALLLCLIPCHRNYWAGLVSTSLSLVTLVLAFALFFQADYSLPFRWLHTGDYEISFVFVKDSISSGMGILVCGIHFLVQIFSFKYMTGDRLFSRYFAYLGLFTFAMLGIVFSGNLLQTFIFWELVGLSSYLLISFWHTKPETGPAGNKAFILNRMGDIGFLAGLLIIGVELGTFSIEALKPELLLTHPWLNIAGILLLIGALGKSAQFPFQAWLPDAMVGPTPASALIHAATMVAAGIYFCARIFPILGTEALLIASICGTLTALLAGLSACVQTDIKKVLAYSTLSQLGLMLACIGAGAPDLALFHLFTHAFFKCGLFLAAGAVLYHRHKIYKDLNDNQLQDINHMQAYARILPVTAACFAIFGLSMSGVPLFSGFLSKEGILNALWIQANTGGLSILILLCAGISLMLTPVYMLNVWFKVFAGRSNQEKAGSPLLFTIPLGILAFFSTAFFLNPLKPWSENGSWIFEIIAHVSFPDKLTAPGWMPFLSIGITAIGILIALAMRKYPAFRPALLYYHFGMDAFWMQGKRVLLKSIVVWVQKFEYHIVDGIIRNVALFIGGSSGVFSDFTLPGLSRRADKNIIDASVHWLISIFAGLGWLVRKIQGGSVQGYMTSTFLLLALLCLLLMISQ